MKWIGPGFLIILVLSLFFTLKKYYPDYFLKFNFKEYKIEQIPGLKDKDLASLKAWEIADKLYPFLIKKVCNKKNCNLGISAKSFGQKGEEPYYIDLPEDISSLKKQTATEQFRFYLLKEENIIINYDRQRKKEQDPSWPWLGAKPAAWNMKILISQDHSIYPNILKIIDRLDRDYPNLRIYFFPFQRKESFQKDFHYVLCLKERRIFWQSFRNRKDFFKGTCNHKAVAYDYPKYPDQGLRISMMGKDLNTYPGYLELIKKLQPQYLQSKMKLD